MKKFCQSEFWVFIADLYNLNRQKFVQKSIQNGLKIIFIIQFLSRLVISLIFIAKDDIKYTSLTELMILQYIANEYQDNSFHFIRES